MAYGKTITDLKSVKIEVIGGVSGIAGKNGLHKYIISQIEYFHLHFFPIFFHLFLNFVHIKYSALVTLS